MRSISALCLTVVTSMAAAVAGLVAVRAAVPPDYLQPSNDVGGGYLQTVGTIYAVLLAFVVFVVWTQSNDARRLVERQADELADVLRITAALGGPVAGRVAAAARAYAREAADRIEQRTYSWLWDLNDGTWQRHVVPALEQLRGLPEPDRARPATLEYAVRAYDKPA